MRVCIDARMAYSSGIGTCIRHLILHLLSQSVKLKLIASFKDGSKLQNCLTGGEYEVRYTRSLIYSITEQCVLPFLIPECDLFFSPHYNVPLLPIRAYRKIVTIHDVYHLAFAKQLGFHERFYARKMVNRAVKQSDFIITSSYFSKGEILKYTDVEKEKVKVIYLGVDSTRFCVDQPHSSLEFFRLKYRLPSFFFLCVGVPKPHKNFHRLIKAWNGIQKEFPDWKLVFVGRESKKGGWEKVISNLSASFDQILILRDVEDSELADLYRLAYALVHPSIYEGFGLTLLEAMSSGCPVVSSNRASLPEVCGEAALYFNPFDIEEMGNAMRRLISDRELYHRLRQAGLIRSRKFSWKEMGNEYLNLARELL